MEKKIFGVGTNTLRMPSFKDNKRVLSYVVWYNMLRRAYSEEYHKWKPTYAGCSVCNEWLDYSAFKIWFDKNYVRGWELDKDLIVFENKEYSPLYCCFIPKEINMFLAHGSNRISKYLEGACFDKSRGKFISYISINGKQQYLGRYDNEIEAHKAYLDAKIKYAVMLAHKYSSLIEPRAYSALINFKERFINQNMK